jgi:hypothetical protein
LGPESAGDLLLGAPRPATRVRYFVWLQHAQPLHLQGVSQPHSGEQLQPFLPSVEQPQAALLHCLQEHPEVLLFMTSSPFLEHLERSSG